MSYTQLVDLENVVNCYFKKNANDSEFLVFFNQQEEEILNKKMIRRKCTKNNDWLSGGRDVHVCTFLNLIPSTFSLNRTKHQAIICYPAQF